jgi:hypothetical protein
VSGDTPKAEPSHLPMTDFELGELRYSHRADCRGSCAACGESWPCRTAQLLATIAARDEENTGLRIAEQQAFERGCQHEYVKAESLRARVRELEASELKLTGELQIQARTNARLGHKVKTQDKANTMLFQRVKDAPHEIAALRSSLSSMTTECQNLANRLRERDEVLAGEIEARKKAEAERDARDRMIDIAHDDRVKDSAYIESLTRQRDELRGVVQMREGTIQMAVDRLGGRVEGRPTHRGNFLQRIDELVRIEVDAFRALELQPLIPEPCPPSPSSLPTRREETKTCRLIPPQGHSYMGATWLSGCLLPNCQVVNYGATSADAIEAHQRHVDADHPETGR